MTGDIAAFLRARYDEEEMDARAAPGAGRAWCLDEASKVLTVAGDENAFAGHGYTVAAGRHIAHWDPARALRQVERDRRILDRCERAIREVGIPGEDQSDAVADDIIRSLALPYAGHPDYRPEWRP